MINFPCDIKKLIAIILSLAIFVGCTTADVDMPNTSKSESTPTSESTPGPATLGLSVDSTKLHETLRNLCVAWNSKIKDIESITRFEYSRYHGEEEEHYFRFVELDEKEHCLELEPLFAILLLL